MPEIPPDSPLSESFLLCFWCEKKLLPFQHFPYDGYPPSLFSFSHPSPFLTLPWPRSELVPLRVMAHMLHLLSSSYGIAHIQFGIFSSLFLQAIGIVILLI